VATVRAVPHKAWTKVPHPPPARVARARALIREDLARWAEQRIWAEQRMCGQSSGDVVGGATPSGQVVQGATLL
jgi:hypothetical protein